MHRFPHSGGGAGSDGAAGKPHLQPELQPGACCRFSAAGPGTVYCWLYGRCPLVASPAAVASDCLPNLQPELQPGARVAVGWPGITCCCALLRWQLLAQPVCHHLAVCPPSAVASAPLCAPQVGTCSALTSLCTAFHPTPAASAFLLPFSYSPVPSAGRHVQRPDRPVHLPRGLAGLQLPHAHAAPLRQPLLLFWI